MVEDLAERAWCCRKECAGRRAAAGRGAVPRSPGDDCCDTEVHVAEAKPHTKPYHNDH